MKIIIFVTIVAVNFSVNAFASSKIKDVKEGNALYGEGRFEKSLEKFEEALKEDAESDIINYGLGTAYYKNEDYHKAIDHLQKALLSEDPKLQAQAHYNLGNSFYRIGKSIQLDNMDLAIQSLQESLKHYERSLVANTQDEDAQYNYDFVKKELEQLQDKQQQQQQNQQDQSRDQNQPQSQENEKQNNEQDNQQQDQQSPQENEESKDKDDQVENDDPAAQKQPETDNQQNQPDPSEISRREAEMMLNDYEQNEEPQSLLNFTRQRTEFPVVKDW